jgi:membrane protein DedA with SNARE-associated domain
VDQLLEFLRGLNPFALYAVACVAAAAENVFPPLPSDVVVAFAAFLAAQGRGSAVGAFLAVWVGNVAGAMFMYQLGARIGAERVLRRFGATGGQEAKLHDWYARYGLLAIAVSRFLPGVRAIVPPVAGALRVGAVRAAIAMAIPSGIWYAAITYFAFTAGNNFDALRARIAAGQRWMGIAAGVLVAAALLVWWIRRRQRAAAST